MENATLPPALPRSKTRLTIARRLARLERKVQSLESWVDELLAIQDYNREVLDALVRGGVAKGVDRALELDLHDDRP